MNHSSVLVFLLTSNCRVYDTCLELEVRQLIVLCFYSLITFPAGAQLDSKFDAVWFYFLVSAYCVFRSFRSSCFSFVRVMVWYGLRLLSIFAISKQEIQFQYLNFHSKYAVSEASVFSRRVRHAAIEITEVMIVLSNGGLIGAVSASVVVGHRVVSLIQSSSDVFSKSKSTSKRYSFWEKENLNIPTSWDFAAVFNFSHTFCNTHRVVLASSTEQVTGTAPAEGVNTRFSYSIIARRCRRWHGSSSRLTQPPCPRTQLTSSLYLKAELGIRPMIRIAMMLIIFEGIWFTTGRTRRGLSGGLVIKLKCRAWQVAAPWVHPTNTSRPSWPSKNNIGHTTHCRPSHIGNAQCKRNHDRITGDIHYKKGDISNGR